MSLSAHAGAAMDIGDCENETETEADVYVRLDGEHADFGVGYVFQQHQLWSEQVAEFEARGLGALDDEDCGEVCKQASTWALCALMRCAELRHANGDPRAGRSQHALLDKWRAERGAQAATEYFDFTVARRRALCEQSEFGRTLAALEWLERFAHLRPDAFRTHFRDEECASFLMSRFGARLVLVLRIHVTCTLSLLWRSASGSRRARRVDSDQRV